MNNILIVFFLLFLPFTNAMAWSCSRDCTANVLKGKYECLAWKKVKCPKQSTVFQGQTQGYRSKITVEEITGSSKPKSGREAELQENKRRQEAIVRQRIKKDRQEAVDRQKKRDRQNAILEQIEKDRQTISKPVKTKKQMNAEDVFARILRDKPNGNNATTGTISFDKDNCWESFLKAGAGWKDIFNRGSERYNGRGRYTNGNNGEMSSTGYTTNEGCVEAYGEPFINWFTKQESSFKTWFSGLNDSDKCWNNLFKRSVEHSNGRGRYTNGNNGEIPSSSYISNEGCVEKYGEPFIKWFAKQDRSFQTWFAEQDQGVRDYLAARDQGFRDWLAEKGGWPKEAQHNFGNKVRASYSYLKYIVETCGDFRSPAKEFLSALEETSDSTNIFHSLAKNLFYEPNGYASRCVGAVFMPAPKFILPTKPNLPNLIIAELFIQIVKMEKELNVDILTTKIPFIFETNEIGVPFRSRFPGVCAGLVREKGELGFYGLNSLDWQDKARIFAGEYFSTISTAKNPPKTITDLCKIGDGIKFTGLAYYAEPTDQFQKGIRDSFDLDGRPHRSFVFREIWHKHGAFTGAYSKDMSMGLAFYFLRSKDTELALKFKNYLIRTGNFMCPRLPLGHKSMLPRPGTSHDTPDFFEKGVWVYNGGRNKKDPYLSQYGVCFLPTTSMFDRVYRKIGLDAGKENRTIFYLEEVLILAGLKNSDLDFEYHLNMLDIFLFTELGMLTDKLAFAAKMGSKIWHSQADEGVENLFYQFLANYTQTGDQGKFEEIADKLLAKMKCWDSPDPNKKECRNINTSSTDRPFNHRQGWSFQRNPKSEETYNPFGHDLLFLAKLLITSEKLEKARRLIKINPNISVIGLDNALGN